MVDACVRESERQPETPPCAEDGYVWEEGPNSYQPGDAILTVGAAVACCTHPFCDPPRAGFCKRATGLLKLLESMRIDR